MAICMVSVACTTSSCGGEDPPIPASVIVSPSNASVPLGESVQLLAEIRDQRGASYSGTVSWSSRDLDVATVGAAGSVRSITPGSVTIVATFESISGESSVTVTDDVPPTLSILGPLDGETVFGVTTVRVEATDNHRVDSVVLFLDGASEATLQQPPWEFSWNTTDVPNGQHSVRVVAADASGNETTTFSLSVLVANPPVAFQEWQALPPLPIPVRSAAVATDGSRVYVAGGTSAAGRTDVLQILDLATESWSLGGSLPQPVDWGTATWDGNQLHFMGGASVSGFSSQHLVYDAGRADWLPSTPLPTPIAGTASVAHSSSIYVFAGNSGTSPAHTASTFIFDVDLQSWSTGRDVTGPRINWSGATSGTRIFLIGGGTPGLNTSADLLAYDPDADSWSSRRSIPQRREAHGTAVIAGLICGIGGRLATSGNFGTPFDDVSCYDPASDTWYPAPALPRPLQEVNAVSTGDAIIAIGGADAGTIPVGDVSILRIR